MKCKYCGKAFMPRNRGQKFCGKRCVYRYNGEMRRVEYKTTTLCWNCANTNDSCPWFSKAAKPVPGWKAKKVKYKMSNGEYVDSYIVKECPDFENMRSDDK